MVKFVFDFRGGEIKIFFLDLSSVNMLLSLRADMLRLAIGETADPN